MIVQLSDQELRHAESVHEKVGEVEAKLMGDMAYLKVQHQEQMEDLRNNCNAEVSDITGTITSGLTITVSHRTFSGQFLGRG